MHKSQTVALLLNTCSVAGGFAGIYLFNYYFFTPTNEMLTQKTVMLVQRGRLQFVFNFFITSVGIHNQLNSCVRKYNI